MGGCKSPTSLAPAAPSCLPYPHRRVSPMLFLADDRRAWAHSTPLQGLWQRLRLAMLTCLLAAHRAAQAQAAAQQTARAVAGRILGHMRAALQRDWL